MKHTRSLTKLPARADSDYEPGPIPIDVLITFIVAILGALSPLLEAKFPTG
jgi:hypothetical protein